MKSKTLPAAGSGRAVLNERDRSEPRSVCLPAWQWGELDRLAHQHEVSRSQLIGVSVSDLLENAKGKGASS